MNDTVIFVIDDDESVRDSVKVMLETLGMCVEVFESTEAFVPAYRPHRHQCLILDQDLTGGKTGLEFLASPDWDATRLPVILVTGRGDSSTKAQATKAGVFDYLEKPTDADQLILAVERALAKQ